MGVVSSRSSRPVRVGERAAEAAREGARRRAVARVEAVEWAAVEVLVRAVLCAVGGGGAIFVGWCFFACFLFSCDSFKVVFFVCVRCSSFVTGFTRNGLFFCCSGDWVCDVGW